MDIEKTLRDIDGECLFKAREAAQRVCEEFYEKGEKAMLLYLREGMEKLKQKRSPEDTKEYKRASRIVETDGKRYAHEIEALKYYESLLGREQPKLVAEDAQKKCESLRKKLGGYFEAKKIVDEIGGPEKIGIIIRQISDENGTRVLLPVEYANKSEGFMGVLYEYAIHVATGCAGEKMDEIEEREFQGFTEIVLKGTDADSLENGFRDSEMSEELTAASLEVIFYRDRRLPLGNARNLTLFISPREYIMPASSRKEDLIETMRAYQREGKSWSQFAEEQHVSKKNRRNLSYLWRGLSRIKHDDKDSALIGTEKAGAKVSEGYSLVKPLLDVGYNFRRAKEEGKLPEGFSQQKWAAHVCHIRKKEESDQMEAKPRVLETYIDIARHLGIRRGTAIAKWERKFGLKLRGKTSAEVDNFIARYKKELRPSRWGMKYKMR